MPIRTNGQALKNKYRNFVEGNNFDGYDGVVKCTKTSTGWKAYDTVKLTTRTLTDEEMGIEMGFSQYQEELGYDPKAVRGTGLTAREYAEGK